MKGIPTCWQTGKRGVISLGCRAGAGVRDSADAGEAGPDRRPGASRRFDERDAPGMARSAGLTRLVGSPRANKCMRRCKAFGDRRARLRARALPRPRACSARPRTPARSTVKPRPEIRVLVPVHVRIAPDSRGGRLGFPSCRGPHTEHGRGRRKPASSGARSAARRSKSRRIMLAAKLGTGATVEVVRRRRDRLGRDGAPERALSLFGPAHRQQRDAARRMCAREARLQLPMPRG